MFFYSSKLPGKNLNQKINLVFLNYNIEKKYLYYLSMLIRRPKKIFAVAVLLSFIGLVSLIMRPVVFINPDDAKEVWVSVVFPPGTLLEVIEEYSIESSRKISGLPYVNTVYGRAGSEEGDVNRRADIDYRREELILRCVLNRRVNPQKALSGIKLLLEQNDELPFLELPFLVYFPKDRSEVLLGLSSSNTYVIKGRDREELLKRLGIAENEFNEKSIHANFFPRGLRPELRYLPNRETSAFLSVPAAQIAETLFILNEGIIATRLEIEGRPLDVRVTGQNPGFDVIATGLSGNNLEQIPIITPLGRTVFLGSLGNIVYKEAEASLARLDRQDIMYVEVSAARNNSKTINRFVTQNSWFSGVDDSVFSRYKNSLIVYVFLVLILLYMTMGALFESFLLPIILMISIPFSLAGAGPALLLAGSQIDSGAVLGLIVLFGLVVNNSLILFEISDQKIKKGFTPAVAVFNGARERYRAILITMLTTIFALLPLIISPMGNSQKSMAAAMLGGLTVSTLLSLFVIPAVLIRYFKWKKLKVVNDGGIE
jgi:multidrug efflux pump subunit AcrB